MRELNLALSTDEQGGVHLAVSAEHRNRLSSYQVVVAGGETIVTVVLPGVLASINGDFPVIGAAAPPPRPKRR